MLQPPTSTINYTYSIVGVSTMPTNHNAETNTTYDHDVASETDSMDTLSSQRIYTPTSSVYGAESESRDHFESEVALTEGEQAPLEQQQQTLPLVDEKRVHTTIQVESEEEVKGGRGVPAAAPRRPRYFRGLFTVIMMFALAIWLYRAFENYLTTVIPLCISITVSENKTHANVIQPRSPKRICHGHRENAKVFSPKREIVVDHGHNSIWGKYPLFDLLSLTTTSGNIGVAVMPQPADPRKPDEPARLRIRSQSGSVTISFTAPMAASLPEMEAQMEVVDVDLKKQNNMERRGTTNTHTRRQKTRKGKEKTKDPNEEECKSRNGLFWPSRTCKDRTKSKSKSKPKCKGGCHRHQITEKKQLNMEDLPVRPYEIDIETQSGTISGRFVFSTSAHLSTTSGEVDTTLVPVYSLELNQKMSMVTQSTSGSQQVRLTEPVYVENQSSTSPSKTSSSSSPAQAKHISHGGASMQIAYPSQWAGKVHTKPDSGSISLAGQGLKVARAEDGSVLGSKEGVDGEKWWGGRGDMNVSLDSKGAVMFTVG